MANWWQWRTFKNPINSTDQTARDGPRLDQLQNLGSLAVAPTLTFQQHQDAAACGLQITPFSGGAGDLIMATSICFQLGAIVSRRATGAIQGLGQNCGHNKSGLQKI
jgi:hypothetical protein